MQAAQLDVVREAEAVPVHVARAGALCLLFARLRPLRLCKPTLLVRSMNSADEHPAGILKSYFEGTGQIFCQGSIQ